MTASRPPALSLKLTSLILALAASGMSARAADWATYNPANPSNTVYYWGDPAMWSTGVVPDAPGAVANISADLSGTLSPAIRLSNPAAGTTAVNRTLGSLIIGDTTATTATDGTPMTKGFGNFIFDNNGLGASLSTPTTPAVMTSGLPASSVVAVSSITLNDDLLVTNNNGPAAGTFNSALSSLSITSIAETGSARKVTFTSTGGVGTSSIGAASTYSGGTDILAGRVAFSDGAALGTGTVTVSSGAQAQLVAANATVANNFTLNGDGWAEAAGTRGALSIGANNTTSARSHIFTGDIAIASASRIEAWSNVTADLNGALTGSAALDLKGGVVRVNGNGSGFTGDLTVSAGRLDVNGSLGGNVVVSILGAGLGGEGTIAGNLELAGVGGPPVGSAFYLDPASAGSLHAGGNLTLSGPVTVNLTSAPVGATTTVMTYGGALAGGANFDLAGGVANYRAGTGFDTSTPGVVKLNYVTGTTTWNGGDSGSWNSFGTGWVGGDTFRPFDNALFDGTVTPGAVSLGTAINAGTITVNNAAGTTYSFNGAGTSIIASGDLVKNGEGTLIMGTTTASADNQHTFNTTTINAGVVKVGRNGDTTSAKLFGPLGIGTTTMKGGALTSVGTSARTLTNDFAFAGNFTLGASATDTGRLTLNGGVVVTADSVVNTASEVYIGTSATSPGLSGTAKLTKTGTANLRINGTSSYGGALRIEAGSLTVGSGTTLTIASGGSLTTAGGSILAGSATTSAIAIESGATLGGVGSVAVRTTIGGIHSPGSSPGVQTFSNNLTYSPTSTLMWELDSNDETSRGTTFDGVDVTGGTFDLQAGAVIGLSFTGTTDFTNAFWDSARSWLVVDLGASVTDASGANNFALGSISGGGYTPAEGSFSTTRTLDGSGKNDIYLTWTPVPEPSAALLALLGAGAFLRRRRA